MKRAKLLKYLRIPKQTMTPLKHILVVVALLATMLPCGHAALHHDDDHHHDADVERCCVAVDPCACHSCEHPYCADPVQIQTNRTSDIALIEHPATLKLLFRLPETKPALQKARPTANGMLAALQTVQLLI